jgi:hypothetical protein
MKKHFPVLLILMVVLVMMSFSKKPLYKSKALEPVSQRPEPGTAAWIDKLQYNDKDKIAYGCFNDDSNLVIRLKVTDKNVVTKIFAAGFTISIDTTGKKDAQFSIKYPLPQGMQSMPHPGERDQMSVNQNLSKNPNDKLKNRLKTALNQIEINGFDDIAVKNATVNSRNGDGITAWIMIDSVMNMYYELKIPLKELSGKDNLNENIISLGFESGRMELPATGQGGGGGTPGGGMSSPGGSHGGGGQGGSMNPRNPDMQQRAASMETLTEPIKIWMKRIELN